MRDIRVARRTVVAAIADSGRQQIEKCEQRRRRHYDEPALVSAVDGAGSAMLFFGCDGDLTRAGHDRFYNHINRIGSQ